MLAIEQRLCAVNQAVGSVIRWFALAMALIQFAVVLLRYVFGFSDIALNESVLYLHAFLFMLGAGYTLLVDGHVRVDILYSNLSEKVRLLIDLFGHIFLLIPAMLIVLYWSWPSIRNSWAIFEGPISVGGIPASFLLKSLIPAFCILLIIQSLACILRNLVQLRGWLLGTAA